jgi:molybdenum ABC transporter molybdate-binding protein
MRIPVERIAAEYEQQYGVHVQLQYGGSNTLLSQMEVSQVGDLYLAADEMYIDLAQDKGLVREAIPVARMRPVLAVAAGNPQGVSGIKDLLRDDVRVALANADQAAVGREARALLRETGQWSELEQHVRAHGVFKPTVSDVANDIKLGAVDAGIVWDATAAQYPEIEAIPVPELEPGVSLISVGVMSRSKQPTTALRFARFLAARDRGLRYFSDAGFQAVDGDVWAEVPELTFFVGSVNRRALEETVKEFAQREVVEINTVYNGCGILTAQMRSMLGDDQTGGFPDMYMACDVYYLDTVRDLFQDAVNVSNTDIVIVVQEGNPKQIQGLPDLARPGVRVAVGQPEQCTIGVLSKRLLQAEGLYEEVQQNIVTQTATSALLVPNITTGSADAVLAYATDTLAEQDKCDTVPIDSPLAKAIQPYSIARSSDFKYLGRRLYQAIARSRERFEKAGFVWRLDQEG